MFTNVHTLHITHDLDTETQRSRHLQNISGGKIGCELCKIFRENSSTITTAIAMADVGQLELPQGPRARLGTEAGRRGTGIEIR